MALNKKEIKIFWDTQAEKSAHLKLEGISNLEEDQDLLEKKLDLENRKVNSWLGCLDNLSILDLGSGTGQWATLFAKKAKNIAAVEYSESMQSHAKALALREKIENIDFICKPAQEYVSELKVDLIWISGLLIYLEDSECDSLIKNCKNNLSEAGKLVLRDGTGNMGRHEINSSYSLTLKAHYSAIYRTREEYAYMFEKHGFSLVRDENMFVEGSELNKWKETRLRIYEFNLL